jgi:myo-inositol-1(or 4)-monophosphatase
MRAQLRQAVKAAGKIALDHYGSVSMQQADRKGQADYVSFVDRSVQDELICRLKQTFPDHTYIGEENDVHEQSAQGPHWIIDPIDGTTNFLREIPAWCISVCFCSDVDDPKMAVIYDPVHDDLFEAEANAGAWRNGSRIHSSGCGKIEDALWAGALPFRYPAALAEVLATFAAIQSKSQDMRRGGSAALDLAAVACGRLDAYWEGFIYPWDVAAGELLVRESGGAATSISGSDSNLLSRRSIIAAASPRLHQEFLHACQDLAPIINRVILADQEAD